MGLLVGIPAIAKLIGAIAIPVLLFGFGAYACDSIKGLAAAEREVMMLAGINRENQENAARLKAVTESVMAENEKLRQVQEAAEARVDRQAARLNAIPSAGKDTLCPIDCMVPQEWWSSSSSPGAPPPPPSPLSKP